MNGPIAQAALLSLALPSSSAERPSTSRRLTSLPSVAPTMRPRLETDEHDLRLGIVPARDRVQADLGADGRPPTSAGALVKISASGPMPTSRYCDHSPSAISASFSASASAQPGLSRAGRRRSTPAISCADRLGPGGVAARLLLDDPLQHRDGEGDAARLDRLQVDRREQPRTIAGPGGDLRERPERASGRGPHQRGGVVGLEQVAHGRHGAAGDVEHHALADGRDTGAAGVRRPDAAEPGADAVVGVGQRVG